MRITADEARAYFAHPSQRRFGLDPADLPDGIEYWAVGPICGVFHRAFWPCVWMGHFGVLPEGWGRLEAPAREVIREFASALRPARIIGWIEKNNQAAVAFARRIGFEVDGEMPMQAGAVIMMGMDVTWL